MADDIADGFGGNGFSVLGKLAINSAHGPVDMDGGDDLTILG